MAAFAYYISPEWTVYIKIRLHVLCSPILVYTAHKVVKGTLTLSQTTNFGLFQTESLQMTILSLMKMAESSQKV